jgi:hypothetical protein
MRSCNPVAALDIALREVPLKSWQCDFLLLVDRKPVGLIEAKKEGTLLSGAAEQWRTTPQITLRFLKRRGMCDRWWKAYRIWRNPSSPSERWIPRCYVARFALDAYEAFSPMRIRHYALAAHRASFDSSAFSVEVWTVFNWWASKPAARARLTSSGCP